MKTSENIAGQLGFDSIMALIKDSIYGASGYMELGHLRFMTDTSEISHELLCVEEYIELKSESKGIAFFNYPDISNLFENLHVDNYIFGIDQIKDLHIFSKLIKDINRNIFPSINKWIALNEEFALYDTCQELMDGFDRYLNLEGAIKENATPELVRIGREIYNTNRNIDNIFNQVLNRYKKNKWLADAPEAIRAGRRVLSVSSENKRKINGIIHDQSDTGKTTYIEPQEIVFLYNEIQHLNHEKRKEIQRILAELSGQIRNHGQALKIINKIIGRLDFIQSKARLALSMAGISPKLVSRPHFSWKEAVHPLLWLKNKKENKETIRFNFELHDGVHAVLISGPNAGGKSICLKALGLLQMMLQHGLLVPMDDESTMGVFNAVYTDIGDHQSIDDELSTYSSKLLQMQSVMQEADDTSLVLMDEFGSGSDPAPGGAIGEGWLDALLKRKAWAVLTTHYSNLKMYAHKKKGIINATMLFDKENLEPLYLLRLGRPGSSYTFEIAEKVNLQSEILAYAKRKLGKNNVRVEDLLVDLQNEKAQIEKNNQDLTEQQKKLQQLITQYDILAFDLDVKKKKFLLDQKQWKLQADIEKKRLLKEYAKEIRKKEDRVSVEKDLQEIKTQEKVSIQVIQEIKEEVFYRDVGKDYKFKQGDFVKINGTQSTGEIKRLQKNRAIVQSGLLEMTVATADLRPINEPLDVSKTRSIKIDKISDSHAFNHNIDIRGYTAQEANDTLTRFFDEAIMSSATQLIILHGKGSGVLKRIVKSMAMELPNYKGLTHPEDDAGGDGVSVVEIG